MPGYERGRNVRRPNGGLQGTRTQPAAVPSKLFFGGGSDPELGCVLRGRARARVCWSVHVVRCALRVCVCACRACRISKSPAACGLLRLLCLLCLLRPLRPGAAQVGSDFVGDDVGYIFEPHANSGSHSACLCSSDGSTTNCAADAGFTRKGTDNDQSDPCSTADYEM